jgi:hypothetical protein
MPPKRISKAQAEIMRNKQIVDNIREMSGLRKGITRYQSRASDEDLEAKMRTKRLEAQRRARDFDKDWLNQKLKEWLGQRFMFNVKEGQNATELSLDRFRNKITPEEFKEGLTKITEKSLKRQFPDKQFDDLTNQLNSLDLTEEIERRLSSTSRNWTPDEFIRSFAVINEVLSPPGELSDLIHPSMRRKYGRKRSEEMVAAKLADENAFKSNKGFKKMKGKDFLKSDDPLAAKALREITEAFEKKGSKLSREEKNAILDPYLSGEVGRAPAKPTKMSRPRKPKQAQEVRPMTTTGSIYERVKELQRAKRTASSVASQAAMRAALEASVADAAASIVNLKRYQAAKTAANERASAVASQVAEAAGRAGVMAEQAEELARMRVDLDDLFESDEED